MKDNLKRLHLHEKIDEEDAEITGSEDEDMNESDD